MSHTQDTDTRVNLEEGGRAPSRSGAGSPLIPMRSDDDDDVDTQDYAQLLGLYDTSFRNIAEGEVVKGTVLQVTENEVIVDVGFKSEGLIPIEEFTDEHGQLSVQAGDIVDVLLERTEDRDGHVVLSREKAEKMRSGTRSRRPLPSTRS
jgi:small subunit ribosomal protein S1